MSAHIASPTDLWQPMSTRFQGTDVTRSRDKQ